MATVYSDIGTTQNAATLGSRVDGIKSFGKLYTAVCSYTTVSGSAAADVINLVQLPERAMVLPWLCKVYTAGNDSAATFTLDIGDDDDTTAADPDRYADGLDVSADGYDDWTAATKPAATTTEYVLQKTSWIQATLKTFTGVAVGVKMNFKIVYAIV